MGFGFWVSGVNFKASGLGNAEMLASPDHHFCISKELQSSARVQSSSVLTLLWSCLHTSWWLSPILFSWASVQRLPLLSPQEAHTLFRYFLQTVCTTTLSVSEHKMQSPEAVSILESATFSLGDSESNEAWPLVLFELPATVPSLGSMVALVGLEGGLAGSCPHCSKLGPASSTNSGMSLSPQAELCSLLTSTTWELMQVLLLQWSSSELLEELSCFFRVELTMNPGNGNPSKGVFTKGYPATEVIEEAEFQLDELDCLRGPEPVIPLAWVLWQ